MKLPWNRLVIIAVIVVTLVFVWGIVQTSNQAQRLITQEEGSRDDKQHLDAIFVLMGGQTDDLGVPEWVKRRLDRAVELQKERSAGEGSGLPLIVSLGAGTVSKRPSLTAEKFIWFESNSGSEYLNKIHDVDFGLLLKECTSYDTYGNGYFSLIQFAIPAAWRRIAIVTSEFHMPRSKAIFEWMYGLPGAGASLGYFPSGRQVLQGSKGQGFALEYHSVSDHGLNADALKIRQKAEARMLKYTETLAERIKTLPELHDYIYLERRMYNTANLSDFGKESLKTDRSAGLY